MVDQTKKNEQNAAQIIQQQEDEELEDWMRSEYLDFNTTNGFNATSNSSEVTFYLDGAKHYCNRRTTPGENASLWISKDTESFNRAVFDARTKKMRASLFFRARELFQMMPLIAAEHPEMFDN